MSSCTFVIIHNEKAKYVCAHYSRISDLLKGKEDPEDFNEMNMFVTEGILMEDTDTKFCPAVIIDFDTKTLTNTDYNWFDDFEKYLNKDWKYVNFSHIKMTEEADLILERDKLTKLIGECLGIIEIKQNFIRQGEINKGMPKSLNAYKYAKELIDKLINVEERLDNLLLFEGDVEV
jgi:hypothetical protein